jgi:hypothetical protein
MEEQAGNALNDIDFNQAPEAELPASDSKSSEDFFEALDRSVNGVIQDEVQTTSAPQQDPDPQISQEDLGSLEKRYSDSSREAKRLNSRLKELEPYLPVLDAMREDPNLISHVRNYFEGGGQAPESMKDKFELDEDFVFDPDEAMSDTGSDSAKVLNATIDGVVQRRLNETLSRQQMENRRLSDEASFRASHDLTHDQWEDFTKFAKNKTLELEDILYLKNRETREQNIAKEASKGVAAHMRDTQSRPRSLATSGSAQVDKSADDQIFDSILGSDREFDNIFGQ